MNQLLAWLSRALSSWKFWIVIAPWDVGVLVRLGKIAHSLPPGMHFRIPGLDEIVTVNTRLRICSTLPQTMPSEQPGKTRTVTVAIGYSIRDPVKAMLYTPNPAAAVCAHAQAYIAYGGHATFNSVEAAAVIGQEVAEHGIAVEFVYALENVECKTLRILNGAGSAIWSGGDSTGIVPPAPPSVGW